ncbi:MAG: hypothetical protein QOH56_2895 [Pseudonocardiales bacterium]|jgi:hypothetical protein|nr:hypothetical protein [Pseudonocardiales bacterium]
MASWAEIEDIVPELAAKVRARFDAGTNKTMATVRRDGSPRISGTELSFAARDSVEVVSLGMMAGSRKLADVRRDPRVAVHSPSLEPPAADPSAWPGDAKLAGQLVEVEPPADNPVAGSAHFVLDIFEVVLTYVGTPADHLVIETWHPDRGYQRRTRT